ncbi:PHP-associated domain-containing protein [Desulfatibacillum aliphaticivorans]|uniref:PHP-associated domain-containing protein n=1 Tax=Desulfatibacillum aliphaticivorans TaxID=218208 RepID=UPI000410D529|nr:PHP domain-containing protein [Desulfatibacillum aliphaticivorans]
MEFDLHIHTNRFSGCSNIDPGEVIARALAAGLDGIALTEHGIRWPDGEIEKLLDQCGEKKLIVLPGEEAACYSSRGEFQGEFLVFGHPKSLGSALSVEALVERVHESGGVVVAAHPFKRARRGNAYYGCGDNAGKYDLDGMETLHPSYDEEGLEKAWALCQSAGLASIGGSDAHAPEQIGKVRTVFERPIQSLEDLCREIREGRSRAAIAKDNGEIK